MKRLSHSVNIVPVIAKADTMTIEERQEFKQRVSFSSLSKHEASGTANKSCVPQVVVQEISPAAPPVRRGLLPDYLAVLCFR